MERGICRRGVQINLHVNEGPPLAQDHFVRNLNYFGRISDYFGR